MTTWLKISSVAGGAALVGSLAGGLLGFAAGRFGPDLYRHALHSPELLRVGIPTFLGAAAGGALGGGLAAFGLCLRAAWPWRKTA